MTKRGHKNSHNDLTAKFVRDILHYAPKTGVFTWKKQLSWRAPVGAIAGTVHEKGRVKIGIKNKEYFAHRLAWLCVTGRWPRYEVDHRDENQSNNRWKNLRRATSSQNHRNRGPQKNNTSGYKGVCFDKRRGCWIAGVKHHGYRHNLGSFKTALAAYRAYCKKARELHGKFVKLHHTRP